MSRLIQVLLFWVIVSGCQHEGKQTSNPGKIKKYADKEFIVGQQDSLSPIPNSDQDQSKKKKVEIKKEQLSLSK